MRKYVIGGLVTIALLGLFSYNTSNGDSANGGLERVVVNIPLKQRKVITTESINYVNQLVKNGYVLQFVTERLWGTGDSHVRYTLIKY